MQKHLLGANSSEFIEQLYVDYLEKPDSIPKKWREFLGLNDEKKKSLKQLMDQVGHPQKKIKEK